MVSNAALLELTERFRHLIDECNAGTHNLEKLLHRLVCRPVRD